MSMETGLRRQRQQELRKRSKMKWGGDETQQEGDDMQLQEDGAKVTQQSQTALQQMDD